MMALINCPDCGVKVSSAAPACPHCGCPMHQSGMRTGKYNPRHTGQIVAVEQTGKGLKLQRAVAVLLLIVGFTVLFVGIQTEAGGAMAWGAVMTGISLPWLTYVRLARWWRHG